MYMYKKNLFLLLMVVWFATENSHGAVDLLYKEKAHHLMRESHLTERDLSIGTLIDRLGEAIRTSNYKDYVPTRRHLLLDIIGKLNRTILLPMLIKQH